MYDVGKHSEVEGFILKWTFISVFVGVTLVFLIKILALLGTYITSGKLVIDFSKYIWQVAQKILLGR